MKYCKIILLQFLCYSIIGQNSNRPIPDRFPEYEFVLHDSTYSGSYFIAPFYGVRPELSRYDAFLTILDNNGYILWYSRSEGHTYLDFEYEPQHNVFSFIDRTLEYGDFKIMDTSFNVIDTIRTVNEVDHDTHEFLVLENGNYVVSGQADSVVDYSHLTFGDQQGDDSTHLQAFVIQEFNPKDSLVFEWNSNDHVNPLEAFDSVYGYNPKRFDYCHGNAIEKDLDGNYLISFRHTNSIYKIDGKSGRTIWKLGGKDSYFTFPNDAGFSGQHDIRMQENGNISLYDNANMAKEPKMSRAVEYALDTITWTAIKVWEYVHKPSFFARAMGNYQRNDRKHLISYGAVQNPNPRLVYLDENENLISEMFLIDTAFTYRSYNFDLPFDVKRPNVNCINNNGTLSLIAPNGFDNYFWSTGDNTRSIEVNATGTYQVWVNKGIGMVGSFPIIVKDINSYCITTSVKQSVDPTNLEVNAIWDLLGRQVTNPQINNLYLFHYADGHVEKKLWTGSE